MIVKKGKLTDKNQAAGFTLTEVVVASTLLAIAIVPILKALTTAHLNTAIIERRTRSLVLAEAKLDEIKARSIYHYGDTFAEADSSLDGSYLGSVEDVSAGSNLRKITVSVGYDLNGNNNLETNEIEVTLATLVARRW
jgi:prepilin-type N-terminal cleavage/methylation domain-containing protein